MTLQQIRYFISVAESGSISEAAKRLFTAQSSISSAIKEIENTYDITAFIRESTGVRLTRSGEELLIEFKGILSRLDYLDEKYNGSKKRPLGLSVSAQHHICGMASFISVINKLNERYGYQVKASNFTEDGFALFGIFNIDKMKEIQSSKTDND